MKKKSKAASTVIITCILVMCFVIMGCKQKEPSKKVLPKGEKQITNVTLEDWGKVKFVSLFPSKVDKPVRFYLTNKKEKILYKFPTAKKENRYFEGIKEIGFKDINGDKKKDIIVIVWYTTGAGPQAVEPFHQTIIYTAGKNKFQLAKQKMKEVDKKGKNNSVKEIANYFKEK